MIDYLRDIKPLQDQNVSNADIAVHLSSRTATPMAPSPSQYALENAGAVLTDPVLINQRTGTLIAYYESMPAGDDKNLVAWFISEIFTDNEVNTHNYPRSSQYAAIEAGLPQDLQPVASELVTLAGGRPDAGTTEQDVLDIQAAYEQQQQTDQEMQALDNRYITLVNTYIAPLQAEQNTSNEAWQTALNTMASNWGE
jgi:hypothetical protein